MKSVTSFLLVAFAPLPEPLKPIVQDVLLRNLGGVFGLGTALGGGGEVGNRKLLPMGAPPENGEFDENRVILAQWKASAGEAPCKSTRKHKRLLQFTSS